MFVTLADGREVVVQFRTEPLDIKVFKVAKGALGSFAPDSEALHSEELESADVWAYSLTQIVPYGATIESFVKRLEEIAQLPLWVNHYDPNEANILIDEKHEVTASVD
ncbi:hypothetical protein F4861DRAFT_536242 [Xylaria intraflava]|nr:hypothetical protein F4861DRAFT_536242 [Xylaria intraflava]